MPAVFYTDEYVEDSVEVHYVVDKLVTLITGAEAQGSSRFVVAARRKSFLKIFSPPGHTMPGVRNMKEDEKKPIPWEAADPKPPVIQSGHLEDKARN